MKRKIYDKLLDWKNKDSNKVALLIDGARRIGKSYIVEEFGKKEYKSYILIDFFTASNDVKELFDLYLNDLDTLFMYLSSIYETKLYKHESLIIFDEVQCCPRARAAIKYLVKDGRYSYIETGSLVSIKENVKDIIIPSEERHINMYPMDFEEFMWALGNESIIDLIKNNFNKKLPMGQAAHRKAMNYFKQYLIVGGMPDAVKVYADTKDFNEVDKTKRDILTLYKNDIRKHVKMYGNKVENILDSIPEQLTHHEKKFKLASLDKNARFRDYEESFLWLEDSGITNACFNTTEPNIGLKLNKDSSLFKLYMGDTGLLIDLCFDENEILSEEIYKKILLGKLEINEGMLFENIVAQMLKCNNHKLYFYSNSSKDDASKRMEIDFLIAKNKITNKHNISAIEVKSGKNYTLNSLNKLKKLYASNLDTLYVVHTSDYKEENGIEYMPVYMVPLL